MEEWRGFKAFIASRGKMRVFKKERVPLHPGWSETEPGPLQGIPPVFVPRPMAARKGKAHPGCSRGSRMFEGIQDVRQDSGQAATGGDIKLSKRANRFQGDFESSQQMSPLYASAGESECLLQEINLCHFQKF